MTARSADRYRHPDVRSESRIEIDTDAATAIVQRRLFPGLRVVAQRKLYGGSVNRVLEWRTDGEPATIVAKLNDAASARGFERERASLQIYHEHTTLPVPDVWAVIRDEPEFAGSGLLMERISGVPLSDARMSDRGRQHLQRQLARHLIDLHGHHRAGYGSALEDRGVPRWLDNFQPLMEKEFLRVREMLGSQVRAFLDELVRRLDRWLPEASTPTLVHGDLWSNNVLVDDRRPDTPEIVAFIDGLASYCDPEYELAYLRMFRTADETFFDVYRRRHPLRSGFGVRCRVYWLHTALTHVRTFGERYVPHVEQLVRELRGRG